MATQEKIGTTFIAKGRGLKLIRIPRRRRTNDAGETLETNGLAYDFGPDGSYLATGGRPCGKVSCDSYAVEFHDEDTCPDCGRPLGEPDHDWLRKHSLFHETTPEGMGQVQGGCFIEVGDVAGDAERGDPSRALTRVIAAQAAGDSEQLESLYVEETEGFNRPQVVEAIETAMRALEG